VYIKRIRSKIERPGSPRILQSIRGVGYRMRETEQPELDDQDESFE
jgi:DNA-binding response OmpR family regulator